MTLLKTLMTSAGILALAGMSAHAQTADKPLEIVFTNQSTSGNPFWQAVKKGFDDACDRIQADCQMVFTQTEGSIQQELENIQTLLSRHPDALLTGIVDNHAFDDVIKSAREQGVMVLAVNTDDTEGADGNARQAFIGEGFIPAGHALARALAPQFPKDGPLNIVVGLNDPNQNWCQQRAAGVMKYLEEYKASNPDRDITITKINSGNDTATTAQRVGSYLSANPDTTAYFDTAFYSASVARVLKDRGVPPGQVLIAGFDVVPQVLQEIQSGYIQVHTDQQPYMQGFLSVMEVYLAHKVGAEPVDIDTGSAALITAANAGEVLELSKMGLR